MGYEKGGDLIVPSGYTLINSVYQFPLDSSGANYPELIKGLILVVYSGSNWVKADINSSTSTYGWYNVVSSYPISVVVSITQARVCSVSVILTVTTSSIIQLMLHLYP